MDGWNTNLKTKLNIEKKKLFHWAGKRLKGELSGENMSGKYVQAPEMSYSHLLWLLWRNDIFE